MKHVHLWEPNAEIVDSGGLFFVIGSFKARFPGLQYFATWQWAPPYDKSDKTSGVKANIPELLCQAQVMDIPAATQVNLLKC